MTYWVDTQEGSVTTGVTGCRNRNWTGATKSPPSIGHHVTSSVTASMGTILNAPDLVRPTAIDDPSGAIHTRVNGEVSCSKDSSAAQYFRRHDAGCVAHTSRFSTTFSARDDAHSASNMRTPKSVKATMTVGGAGTKDKGTGRGTAHPNAPPMPCTAPPSHAFTAPKTKTLAWAIVPFVNVMHWFSKVDT